MGNVGYTIAYNGVLRDTAISLRAKGLYLLIKSYIGMPDWSLTKRQLQAKCADSLYSFEAAWKELKTAGYLKHYYSTADSGAFCHTYDLLSVPASSPAYSYAEFSKQPNGSCRYQDNHTGTGDYTQIPNHLLRDDKISLPIKALYAIVSHLCAIPGYKLTPKGVMHYCKERIKKFTTLWRQLKLSGLLKQHRHPGDQGKNHFVYSYDLLVKKDLAAPYLTNYHADGTVSTVVTIQQQVNRLKARLNTAAAAAAAAIKSGAKAAALKTKKRHMKPDIDTGSYISKQTKEIITANQIDDVKQQIDYTSLCCDYDRNLLDALVLAIAQLKYNTYNTIAGMQIHIADMIHIADSINDMTVMDLMLQVDSLQLGKISNLTAYLKTMLYNHQRTLLIQLGQLDKEI